MRASVIIANYNYADYLGQAIESALQQTHQPTEVIVVDDGSTDGSRDVMAAFGARIRTIYQSRNKGQNAAQNAAWQIATGDIVLFLDSDDVLLPTALERCAEAFAAPNVVCVQFQLDVVDANTHRTGEIRPSAGLQRRDPRIDLALWGSYFHPPTSGNAYRRSFLAQVMPGPEFTPGGYDEFALDGYLTGRAALSGHIACLHESLGLYRVHGRNKSEQGGVDTLEKLHKIVMRDYFCDQSNQTWARQLGLPFTPDRIRFCPYRCKWRLLSWRLDPAQHPIPGDSYGRLFPAGLRGAFLYPYRTLSRRLLALSGLVAIGILPRPVLRVLMRRMGHLPLSRPGPAPSVRV